MTKLSVNINKVATLRNARGGAVPDLLKVAKDCERFGADGITVHPRPDERHIRYQDVYDLKEIVSTEFNIEGYPSKTFINLVTSVRPTQVTLVPDAPDAITSNAGWQVTKNDIFLKEIVSALHEHDIRVSIFVDPEIKEVEAASKLGADRVELYTEPYARLYTSCKEDAIQPFVRAATCAHEIGLGVNAGHDLSLQNLAYLSTQIPFLKEVSIGHALIADALYLGLERTIAAYKSCLNRGKSQ